MLHLQFNKGMGMIEVIIAMFITVVAVLAVFTLVSPAWKTASRSDNLGRASGILYEQLIRQEARIMNPCCTDPTGTTPIGTPVVLPVTQVFASGQTTAQSGDAQFNVATTITKLAASVWSVQVRVSWTGHTGISESLIVTRQEGFVYPAGCTLGGTSCQ